MKYVTILLALIIGCINNTIETNQPSINSHPTLFVSGSIYEGERDDWGVAFFVENHEQLKKYLPSDILLPEIDFNKERVLFASWWWEYENIRHTDFNEIPFEINPESYEANDDPIDCYEEGFYPMMAVWPYVIVKVSRDLPLSKMGVEFLWDFSCERHTL